MQDQLYKGRGEPLVVLFDGKDPAQCKTLHRCRNAFERTDVEIVDKRYICLYIFPGVKGSRS